MALDLFRFFPVESRQVVVGLALGAQQLIELSVDVRLAVAAANISDRTLEAAVAALGVATG